MAKAKKLPSGNWRVQVYVGKDADGKRIYESVTEPTKKEAEFKAAQIKMGIQAQAAAPLSLHDAVDAFISARSNMRSPWTIRTYQRILAHDLAPLHKIALKDITQEKIQNFVNVFAKDHSPKSVRNVHGLLSTVLAEYAPDLRLTTKLPAKIKPDISIPTDEQILTAIQAEEGYMPIIIRIAATMGLRRAEICALTWDDVADGVLSVNKALAKGPDNQWHIKAPKSYAGKRIIPMPEALHKMVMAIKPENAKPTDPLFPINPDYITKHWYRICQRSGFSCRFHDLRHYNASVMLSLGVPDKYAMARMGHATPNMLKSVYQHLINEKEREEAAKIDAYMAKFDVMQHEMQHKN